MPDIKKIEKTAIKAAVSAGDILKKYYGSCLEIEVKDEMSPLVTVADKQSELKMREIISADFPDHIIVGEEFGSDIPLAEICETGKISWALDPIDGTTAFTAGMPTFVVLIGVWCGDKPLLGLIYQPISNEMWLASGDKPTTYNGKPCENAKSATNPLVIATTSPNYLSDNSQNWWNKLNSMAKTALFGGDGFLYGSLASGNISLVLEEGLKWHDVAALIPVVENSGATIRDHSGNRLKPYQESYTVLATRDDELLAEALALK